MREARVTGAGAASSPTVPPRAHRVDSIQYLRALAALLIVVYHLQPRLERLGWSGAWPGWLSAGVDIFFVISGFIMWVTTAERPTRPLSFIWHRFVRIAPLYYLFTVLMVLLLLAVPSIAGEGRLSPWHVLASFGFWPTAQPLSGRLEPVLPQGWTLNYEMFFYVLFALSLLLAPIARLFTMLAGLGGIAIAGVLLDPAQGALDFYTNGIIIEFAFGLLIGAAFTSGAQLPRPVALALLVVGLIATPLSLTLFYSLPRAVIWGIPAAAIVGGAAFAERARPVFRSPLLLLLGNASYSLYLSHGLTLSVLGFFWARLRLGGTGLAAGAFSMVAIIATCVVGALIYRLVEAPLTRMLRPRRRGALAPAKA